MLAKLYQAYVTPDITVTLLKFTDGAWPFPVIFTVTVNLVVAPVPYVNEPV